MRLRSATEDDAPLLASLRAHPAAAPFLGVRDPGEDALRAELRDGDPALGGRVVIEGPDEEAVGALAWRVANRRSRIVEVSEVVVLPHAQGRGLAAAAVRATGRRALTATAGGLRRALADWRPCVRGIGRLHMTPEELTIAVDAFVAGTVLPNVGAWDAADALPDAVLDHLVELGLSGGMVATEHGGLGFGVADLAPSWRALSRGWISLTGALNPTGLASTLLSRSGTPEQQARWLPGIARGEVLASFSITEPQAGSDLARLETSARRREGRGLVLDGEKRWVAGGVSSDVVFLLADVEGADKPSCVVLPAEGRDSPAWQVGELDKVGYRGVESAAYRFAGHEAPGAEVLGGEDGLGAGARQMLGALDVGRVNVACRALGILDRALTCALDESVGREIGDGVLGDHSHAQLRVGEMVARRAGVEALIARAAASIDAGDEAARGLSTAAKVVASDTAVWAVDRAARLAASRSYAAGDELARLRRDAPQTQIGEGANDALLIALARPALAAHATPA